jgi:HPt (histidine-containing phosphotransfer) domain-containing protein
VTAIFDREEVLRRFENRRDLLQELIELFIENGPPLFEKVRAAISAGDAQELEYAAHSLKGMIATFGAADCAAAALELEKIGRSRELSGAQAALAELTPRYENAFAVLQAIGSQPSS